MWRPPRHRGRDFGTKIMNIRSARFRWILALSFLVAVDGLLSKAVRAQTRMATALTPEAVWDAINAAKDGDIVQLPEGTAMWKNGWNTKHWAKMKAITIQGAGIDKTIICDATRRKLQKGVIRRLDPPANWQIEPSTLEGRFLRFGSTSAIAWAKYPILRPMFPAPWTP